MSSPINAEEIHEGSSNVILHPRRFFTMIDEARGMQSCMPRVDFAPDDDIAPLAAKIFSSYKGGFDKYIKNFPVQNEHTLNQVRSILDRIIMSYSFNVMNNVVETRDTYGAFHSRMQNMELHWIGKVGHYNHEGLFGLTCSSYLLYPKKNSNISTIGSRHFFKFQGFFCFAPPLTWMTNQDFRTFSSTYRDDSGEQYFLPDMRSNFKSDIFEFHLDETECRIYNRLIPSMVDTMARLYCRYLHSDYMEIPIQFGVDKNIIPMELAGEFTRTYPDVSQFVEFDLDFSMYTAPVSFLEKHLLSLHDVPRLSPEIADSWLNLEKKLTITTVLEILLQSHCHQLFNRRIGLLLPDYSSIWIMPESRCYMPPGVRLFSISGGNHFMEVDLDDTFTLGLMFLTCEESGMVKMDFVCNPPPNETPRHLGFDGAEMISHVQMYSSARTGRCSHPAEWFTSPPHHKLSSLRDTEKLMESRPVYGVRSCTNSDAYPTALHSFLWKKKVSEHDRHVTYKTLLNKAYDPAKLTSYKSYDCFYGYRVYPIPVSECNRDVEPGELLLPMIPYINHIRYYADLLLIEEMLMNDFNKVLSSGLFEKLFKICQTPDLPKLLHTENHLIETDLGF